MNPVRRFFPAMVALSLFLFACGPAKEQAPQVATVVVTQTPTSPVITRVVTPTSVAVSEPTQPPPAQPTDTTVPARPQPTPTATESLLPPTPASRVITLANAGQVTLLKRLGQGALLDIAWLPDGQTLTAIHQTGIYLYDAQTLTERQFIPSFGPKLALAASPDGQTLAVSSEKVIQIWSTETGQLVRTLEGHNEFVLSVAFSLSTPPGMDGPLLVSRNYHEVFVWNVASGQRLPLLSDFDRDVTSVAFTPDGKTLVTSSQRDHADPSDTPVRFWDVESGAPLPVPDDINTASEYGSIGNLTFSSDTLPGRDSQLLAGTATREILVWDMFSKETIHRLDNEWWVESLDFSPDGKFLASGDLGNIARVWDMDSGQAIVTLAEHSDELIRATFNPIYDSASGQMLLATATARDGIQLWQIPSGQRVGSIPLVGHADYASDIAYSPDTLKGTSSQLLATAGTDETIWLWDAASGQALQRLTAPDLSGGRWCACYWDVAFSPDGKVLAAGSTDAVVRFWDVETGELLAVWDAPTRVVDSLAYSPDGKFLAVGDNDGNLWLWDLSAGLEPESTFRLDNPPTVLSISFSPDSRTLATGSGFGLIRLWDPTTGELLREMQASNNAVIAEFSPDGSLLVTGSGGFAPDYAVRLWDPVTGGLLRTLEGHATDVVALAFSPATSGRLLASADRDGVTRLWDVSTGQQLQALEQDLATYSVAFSPDGVQLVTSGYEGLIWVWGIP